MSGLKKLAKAFWKDEQGATFVEYILIIAAIGLPLLGLLVYYRGEISQWIDEVWQDIRGGGERDPSEL